jgi:hypothetical protein
MLPAGIVNRKGKFASNSNKAVGNVRPGDGTRVPCINQKQNRLKGNLDRFLLICHDFEAFVNIPIDTFHQHWVVIPSR